MAFLLIRYKKDLDPEGLPEIGLVAEDVEKVNPALWLAMLTASHTFIAYDAVNAMLLNEFLKEHVKGEQLGEALSRRLRSSKSKLKR